MVLRTGQARNQGGRPLLVLHGVKIGLRRPGFCDIGPKERRRHVGARPYQCIGETEIRYKDHCEKVYTQDSIVASAIK